jgi:hypothetical protein
MIQGDSKLLVNQGVADTGAAVIYDTNHFNPVQFTEKLVSNIRAEKNKKIAEREKRNKALAATFENPYKGSLFQTQLLDEVKAAKQKFTQDPTLIYQLDDPTSALGQELGDWKLQIEANANIAKGAEDAYNKDLQIARAKDASGALDPLTFENLNNLSKMSYKDAAKWYQENGTAIVPAADIEDIVGQFNIDPITEMVDAGNGYLRPQAMWDDKTLSERADQLLAAPQNAKLVEGLIRTYKTPEAVKEQAISEVKAKAKLDNLVQKRQPTGGGGSGLSFSGGGFSTKEGVNLSPNYNPDYFSDSEGEQNYFAISKDGKDLPASNFYDPVKKKNIYMTSAAVVRTPFGYSIVGNEAKQTGAVTKAEAEAEGPSFIKGLIDEGYKKDENGDYVQIQTLTPVEVPLDVNLTNLNGKMGMDVMRLIKSANNRKGTTPKELSQEESELLNSEFQKVSDEIKAKADDIEKQIQDLAGGRNPSDPTKPFKELSKFDRDRFDKLVQMKEDLYKSAKFDAASKLKEIRGSKTTSKSNKAKGSGKTTPSPEEMAEQALKKLIEGK